MQLEPYLFFHGRCEEALNFYKECLGGEIVQISHYAGTPMEDQIDPSFRDKVMHASFVSGDLRFMAADGRPGPAPDGNDDIALCIAAGTEAEGQRVFDAMSQGGAVEMPLADAFWGGKFGMFTDKFGVQWMITTS